MPVRDDGWRVHESSATASPGFEYVETISRARAAMTNDSDLRRRRREAVVIHDGDVERPIGQEDVYMRDRLGDLHNESMRHGMDQILDGFDAELEQLLDAQGIM